VKLTNQIEGYGKRAKRKRKKKGERTCDVFDRCHNLEEMCGLFIVVVNFDCV
tara:strand:+ start:529 stop:684 length:156 start_codon:yes stop_codon:yes gene_type:complete